MGFEFIDFVLEDAEQFLAHGTLPPVLDVRDKRTMRPLDGNYRRGFLSAVKAREPGRFGSTLDIV